MQSSLQVMGRAYAAAQNGTLSNDELVQALVSAGEVSQQDLARKDPVGKAAAPHCTARRRVRWAQQDMKLAGLLERDGTNRGRWRLTGKGRAQFTKVQSKTVLLGFSTYLGVALWGSFEDALDYIEGPISLVLTSPPYILARARSYGGPSAADYVDFICSSIEPLLPRMKPGGSIALNVGNDAFVPGSPARSTYRERLVIALEDRFRLCLMDTLIWVNKSKPPGPLRWASITRQQLNTAYEPIYWFALNPELVASNNRRVLMEHTEKHLKLLRSGGELRERSNSDGAHRIRKGKSYSNLTEGRIPRNVLEHGHACPGQRAYKAAAHALGLPVHGAPMPETVAEFLIKFLTDEGDVVVDQFAGSMTTPAVSERLNRRWYAIEQMGEFHGAGATRLQSAPGFQMGEDLQDAMRIYGERQLDLDF